MKEFEKYRSAGLVSGMISILSKRFDLLPDFIEGFCLGLGIIFLLASAVVYNYDGFNLKQYKMNFIKKCFGK